jgi:O-antigen/teichoic acid export membrane protein
VATAIALQGAGRAVLPLLLAALNPGWWGLLGGEVAGRILGVARLARGAGGRLLALTVDRIVRAARRRWRYPTWVLPSSLLDALAVAVPLPLISEIFGVAAAGQFALVQRIAAVPAALVASSFADAIHAEGSRLRAAQVSDLRPLASQTVRRLGLIGAAVYLPVMLFAPLAFPPVFGPDWREAGVIAAILAPYLWLTLVVSPLSRLILVNDRVELKVLADLLCLGLPVAALFAARAMNYPEALAAFSAANLLAYLVYLGIIWRAAGRPRA